MQAYRAQLDGGQIRVSCDPVAEPTPGTTQLRVQVRAAGLNRGELLALHGHPTASGQPVSLGMEAAGTVLETGAQTGGFKVGDRVMGRCHAAYSEQVLMEASDAMPIPESLSWEQAAAIPIASLVVYDMLIAQGHLASGQWLLVTGVSSGVGVLALQLAKSLGARVIGTSGSAAKLQRLQKLGLDVGLHTRVDDFHVAVMAATQEHGADLIVNTVGGTVFAECIRSLAFEGRLAMVGYLDGVQNSPLDLAALHRKRLTLFGVSSKQQSAEQRHHLVQGVVREVLPRLPHDAPLIDKTFAFRELPQAIAYMESDAQLGKVVLRVHS
ncbi:MAG TPA: zinc-binding dehydrogenase [Castellaniella sp.]|uniref:quinone oxidoreductase family protein n=1 Tax=Castellaniella sp. TaxID=1955812 RepID=UPI002EEBE0AD